MDQLIGQSLGHLQVIDLLGEGGMGAVYKGRDTTLQRDVAIKVMHPHFARQTDFRERFLQEARTAARLDHPGIVKIFEFGVDQTRSLLYIVMEFIPGDNLQQLLKTLWRNSQWLPLPEALQLIREVCLAVDYTHRQGVLHRDLKPANIMLKAEPIENLAFRPVLTDLGLAKLVEGGLDTQEGISMGTPAYMSPEQALGEPIDARSDVYSLGILLYELVVGRLPFPIKSLSQAIHYHTKEAPPPPRLLHPDLPEPLEQIILKVLAKKPAERLPSAAALAEALADLLPAVSPESVPPTVLAGVASLMTHYQESLVEKRGKSIMDEFPPIPEELSQDRITILAQGQATRSIQMTSFRLIIGRNADNDLVLDEPTVSGHHARVEFDGRTYKVVDLDSSNGTYLANARLQPGVPEIWTPDKVLRIGKNYLRLERGQIQPGSSAMVRSDGTLIDRNSISFSPGAGRVAAFMEPEGLSVEPGSSSITRLTILNQGQVVDHFEVSVQGVPAEWVSLSPPVVQLLPGLQHEVTLAIHPPRSPRSQAKTYPLTIRVASQESPDQVAELLKTLTVTAYHEFRSQLQPQRVQAGKSAVITVENMGNTRQTFDLKWEDQAKELIFNPPQTQMTIAEGETGTAKFQAALPQPRWLGGLKAHPISVQVSPPEGQAQALTGEVTSSGLIPVWLPPLLLFLCLVLAAAGAFGYNAITTQNAAASATAQAAATQTAQAIAAAMTTRENEMTATARAATETADALKNANQATLAAATATATWLEQDDDRDGLSNGQELNLGTKPDKRDTDEDGLDDADELARDTDPLKPDTDGDGVKDGDEVSRGLNSLNRDTDDDGTPDASDVDPIHPPTSTFTPTPTVTATPTPTATPKCSPGVLFCDNFEDGRADGWAFTDENGGPITAWPIEAQSNNHFLVGTGHNWAIPRTSQMWDDYRVRFRLKLLNGTIHVNYRLTDPTRYFIGFNQEGLSLNRQIRDQFTYLTTVPASHSLGRWYEVEIVGWGGHLQVYVDGQLELDYTDSSPLQQGTIAFETLDNSQAQVDDIEVMEPGPEPAPPPRQQCGPDIFFCDNFEDGRADGWELNPGWQIDRDGSNYILSGSGHTFAILRGADHTWDNYRVRFRLKLLQGTAHLVYRLTTEGPLFSRYWFGFQEGFLYLHKNTSGGGFISLTGVPASHSLGQWHQVEIVGWGGHLRFYLDGNLELDYTDSNPIRQGTIAFETLDNSQAQVDDIEVMASGPE